MNRRETVDKHGIVPKSFMRAYPGANTIDEALRLAEQAPSTTPLSEQTGVCPECGTRRISPKNGKDQPQKINTAYRCVNSHHFCEPASPESMENIQNTYGFEWTKESDLQEPDEAGMSPLFDGLRYDTLAELAIRLYKPWTDGGPPYRQLAELFPYAAGWIGRRVREWKRGEHRDLVEQPGPTVDATGGADAIATDGGEPRSRWAAYGSD